MQATPFHVYADDGFESAHATERSAKIAAKRGSKIRRGIEYRVIRVNSFGVSNSGDEPIARFRSGFTL